MGPKPSICGLDLSEAFFREAVRPIIEREFPRLRYSCGLIGRGSEVLGFDDEMSTDHDWGPRVLLFLSEADHDESGPKIADLLSRSLPRIFRA